MVRKLVATTIVSTLATLPLMAEDLPVASVDVGAEFVSNYVWRGQDLFKNKAVQDGKSYGSHTGAWAFQPDVTINTPVEGLYFNIWGSFAMQGRNDIDSDSSLQTGPGKDDLIAPFITRDGFNAAAPGEISQMSYNAGWNCINSGIPSCADDNGPGLGVPGMYREENGLKRADEIDFTIGYESETTLGTFGFGVVNYNLVNMRGNSSNSEVFVSYTLPSFPLTLAAYNDMTNGGQYYNIGYDRGMEFGDFGVDFGIGAGYGVRSNIQGWTDVTAGFVFSHSGFSLGLHSAYRPDLRMHEVDYDQNPLSEGLPYYLSGASAVGDGRVADPALNGGLMNTVINGMVSTEIKDGLTKYAMTMPGSPKSWAYTFTPTQKLPRHLYWVSVGYSTSF